MTERARANKTLHGTRDQQQRADTFHQLHAGPKALLLVNAWDAGSARVLEAAGAPAIATTSAGIAWALGYSDGEHLPAADLIAACARICRTVHVPVSVDIERGFGRTTDKVCAVVRSLIEAGVVGVNIEDGVVRGTGELAPPAILCERIAALRALAQAMDVRLFINARTDAYLVSGRDPSSCFDEALRRTALYAAAGADGIFAPGLHATDVVRFAQLAPLPVNVYAGDGGSPPVHALSRAGVRRVSLGCGPLQSAYGLLHRIATEADSHGRYDAMRGYMMPGDTINALFTPAATTHHQRGSVQ
jgi:2-methylisocitrate lyase-like PEP mutase family enzyme